MLYMLGVGRQGSVLIRLIVMLGLRSLGDITLILLAFGGIHGCGSAPLKLCFCKAASPWNQSPSHTLDDQHLQENIVLINIE